MNSPPILESLVVGLGFEPWPLAQRGASASSRPRRLLAAQGGESLRGRQGECFRLGAVGTGWAGMLEPTPMKIICVCPTLIPKYVFCRMVG